MFKVVSDDSDNESDEYGDRETHRHEIRLTTIELESLMVAYPGARSVPDAIRLAVRDAIELIDEREEQ